jgi:hypothetical protein
MIPNAAHQSVPSKKNQKTGKKDAEQYRGRWSTAS